MTNGYWMPILHSHLPFVKHPDYDYFLEEHWLFEAITECYIPIIQRLKKLESEGVYFRLTTSVTPPLTEMLADRHLMDKYVAYLDRLIELAQKEERRIAHDSEFSHLPHYYKERIGSIKSFFVHELNYSVLNGYRELSEKGYLEIITCGATHGFLPLLSVNKRAVEVQVELAVASHTKHFGKSPDGIWLPECAYYDGLDGILSNSGIKYFILDSHGLIYGKPTPKYGVFAPIFTQEGVAAFGRDPESSRQVWSSKIGYPGDENYRDFYRDIGYDLDFEYIKPYIDPDGNRVFTGFKYYSVGNEEGHKWAYDPEKAYYKALEHAQNFHLNRDKQTSHLNELMDRPPLIVSPYDTELFGHWWYEGPDFLYHLFREIDRHGVVESITPMEYLGIHQKNQVIVPSPSSWGDKGYYDVWLNKGNDWVYKHLHFMADKLCELAGSYYESSDAVCERLLNQMGRELLLAQSSDWAFLITTRTATEYSTRRTKEHISNFHKLLDMLESNDVDFEFLERVEHKNSIFGFFDFRIYKQ